MIREEFEQLYTEQYEKAVAVAAAAVGGARDVAEDAVQKASVEFLSNLEQRSAITPAMFIRRAVDYARHALAGPGAVKNRKRDGERSRRETPMGTALDLDRALYGPDVE